MVQELQFYQYSVTRFHFNTLCLKSFLVTRFQLVAAVSGLQHNTRPTGDFHLAEMAVNDLVTLL